MTDERDILGKADALLRRHVQPSTDDEPSADVPVLTELVSPPSALPLTAGGLAPAVPPQRLPDDQLAREVVAEVVQAVQARLAGDLERRLTQHLVAQVQASVSATLGDLRQDIANAVGDAVAEALSRRLPR